MSAIPFIWILKFYICEIMNVGLKSFKNTTFLESLQFINPTVFFLKLIF